MNTKTVRGGLAMLAALAMTAGIGLVAASPASALAWDGVYPATSICHKDRKVVKAAAIYSPATTGYYARQKVYLGKIELLYSPKCHTAWGRVQTVMPSNRWGGFNYMGKVLVHRNGGRSMPVIAVGNASTVAISTMVNHTSATSYAQASIYFEGRWNTVSTGSG